MPQPRAGGLSVDQYLEQHSVLFAGEYHFPAEPQCGAIHRQPGQRSFRVAAHRLTGKPLALFIPSRILKWCEHGRCGRFRANVTRSKCHSFRRRDECCRNPNSFVRIRQKPTSNRNQPFVSGEIRYQYCLEYGNTIYLLLPRGGAHSIVLSDVISGNPSGGENLGIMSKETGMRVQKILQRAKRIRPVGLGLALHSIWQRWPLIRVSFWWSEKSFPGTSELRRSKQVIKIYFERRNPRFGASQSGLALNSENDTWPHGKASSVKVLPISLVHRGMTANGGKDEHKCTNKEIRFFHFGKSLGVQASRK